MTIVLQGEKKEGRKRRWGGKEEEKEKIMTSKLVPALEKDMWVDGWKPQRWSEPTVVREGIFSKGWEEQRGGKKKWEYKVKE